MAHDSEKLDWRERALRWMFGFVGTVTLFAFGAALMPASWFPAISKRIGAGDFPEHVLTYYLARNLSLLYGLLGILLVTMAMEIRRFWPLMGRFGWATIVFGLARFAIDSWTGMPSWWTLYEGISTILGGILILALWRKQP